MPAFETTENNDREYREFLKKGEMRLQKCKNCGHMRYPARWVCSECLSEDYDWQKVKGTGSVECFVWYMQPFDPRFTEVPYNVALVRLDEGPRVITNVIDLALGELHIGQRVSAKIKQGRDGRPILDFQRVAR